MGEKLNEKIISELLKLKNDRNLYHRENQNLEFKESFNLAGLDEYFRDFAAFANNKGGYLIFGVKDRPKRELIGLNKKALEQLDKLDPEKISGYLLDIFSRDILWKHDVYKVNSLAYGAFYVHEAPIKPIICKKDAGKGQILKNGEIYFRYGGRTQKIQFAELENIITYRINQNNSQWIDLVQKIGKSGPQNAAILNTENGLIEKDNERVLVIDKDLVEKIKFLKEGYFTEKQGATALKLIGDVHPIDMVEVVKKQREDILKLYPLACSQILDEVKKRMPGTRQKAIYDVIKENDLKNNPNYSKYNFRNRKQEQEYEGNKKLPNGVPSIYNQDTIDFICNILKNKKPFELTF